MTDRRASGRSPKRGSSDVGRASLHQFGSDVAYQLDRELPYARLWQMVEASTGLDGRGRWMDNVLIERLWRSTKYECAYLNFSRNLRK